MLNRQQLKDYRLLRGLSTRDVAAYCDLSQPYISMIETGERDLNEDNYREFVKGINDAYAAKKLGTYVKPPRVNQPSGKKPGRPKKEKTDD